MSSANVSEILAKLRLERQDLNRLSQSQLQQVFLDLTVKEISVLCRVSSKFNSLCKNDSFWRIKVLNDYGIEKMYGSTWRQTAITMDKVNMINLRGRWIDGRTYREILDDIMQGGVNSILNLQQLQLVPYVVANPPILQYDTYDEKSMRDFADHQYLNDYVENDASHFQREMHDEETIQDFASTTFDRPYTKDELDTIFLIKSKEIDVIYASVLTYKGSNRYLPGDTIPHNLTTGIGLPSYEFLREMIDPMLYVMQFSSFSEDRVRRIIY